MKAFPLCVAAVLFSISLISADEGNAKHADLVNIYMQLTPLNDQAKVALPDSIQGVATSHEGQGSAIALNKGAIRYREQGAPKLSDLTLTAQLEMEEFQREGNKFSFLVKVRSVYPLKGLLKSEYERDEVVFSEGSLRGTVSAMGIFQKKLELANGEKYSISISMSPFVMPPDWRGTPSSK